jgi:hypothetical protein
MTKTFCDFCETYIPNPTSYNTWFLPIWEKGIVSKQFCLCDACVQDIATIIDKYKNVRKREKF